MRNSIVYRLCMHGLLLLLCLAVNSIGLKLEPVRAVMSEDTATGSTRRAELPTEWKLPVTLRPSSRMGMMDGTMCKLSLRALQSDERMGLYNQVPTSHFRDNYGFESTQAWINHVRLASVRFNSGWPGSFVSWRGLVMTDHHSSRMPVMTATRMLAITCPRFGTSGLVTTELDALLELIELL